MINKEVATVILIEQKTKKYEKQHERMVDDLQEIIEQLSDYSDDCEEFEDIHGYLQNLISNNYKTNPNVLNQQILEHYYIKTRNLHFYVTGSYEDYLFGFLMTNFGTLTYTTEPRSKWNRFKCEEDCLFPRTIADVVKEFD